MLLFSFKIQPPPRIPPIDRDWGRRHGWRTTRTTSIPQWLYRGGVLLCNNTAREPLYLFINEHSTASLRCRSGSLEIPAADHIQSSLYFQAGCTADSCTLECVWAAGRRGDTCALATQVKSHLPPRGFPLCSPVPSARPPHPHLPSRLGP